MKTILLYSSLLVTILFLVPQHNSAAVIIPASSDAIQPHTGLFDKISTLKLKDLKKLLGRKLTLKEKVGFLVLKHKTKRVQRAETDRGHGALVFGILAIGLFVVGLFVPYVIIASLLAAIIAIVNGSIVLRENKNDRKAYAGKLLGWITLGLIGLLFLLAIIALASIFRH